MRLGSQPEKMAALVKAMRVSRTINNVAKLLTNLSLSSGNSIEPLCTVSRTAICQAAAFHATHKRSDLMEFFDDKKNWGVDEVRCGRSWKVDELRLKSNVDLHKLWFVLLKERNMLLTMEESCKRHWEIFPNPERIDKIADSMENLERVVRERNKAYHLLETGEHGERPSKRVNSQIGLKMMHRMQQHAIPKFMNKKWQEENIFRYGGYAVRKFLRKYYEQKDEKKRKGHRRQYNHVRVLFRKFPHLDVEAVKAKYPNINLEDIKNDPRTRSHAIPE